MYFQLAGLCSVDATAGGIAYCREVCLVPPSFLLIAIVPRAALDMLEWWQTSGGAFARYWKSACATTLGGSIVRRDFGRED